MSPDPITMQGAALLLTEFWSTVDQPSERDLERARRFALLVTDGAYADEVDELLRRLDRE